MQWPERLKELGEDWVYRLKRDGWAWGMRQAFADALALPYRHLQFVIVARSLLEPLPDFQPEIPLDIRPFQTADLNFVRRRHLPSEAKLCQQRMRRGDYGLTACYQGETAGYAWACVDTNLERVTLKLLPGDALCTDAFTAPNFRQKGVQTALTVARLQLLQDKGYKRAIAYIETRNHPSLAVWRKLGAKVISRIDFKRIGLRRITHYY